MRIRSALLVVAVLTLSAVPALAQGAYVSASVAGDLARYSNSTVDGLSAGQNSGSESIGFALRVGVPLGSAWGVEAEFVVAGEVESSLSPSLAALSYPQLAFIPDLSLPYGIDITQTDQRSAFSSLAWARQQLTGRSSLVYLGGVSFGRTATTTNIDYNFIQLPAIPGLSRPTILPPSQRFAGVFYDVHPVVGVEARIGLTDRIELVPGVRLTAVSSGLVIRPAVGLGWVF
jgi:hypothetical protein